MRPKQIQGIIEWALGLFWGWRLAYLMEKGITAFESVLLIPSGILLILLFYIISIRIPNDRGRRIKSDLVSAGKVLLISFIGYLILQFFDLLYL